LTDSVSDAPVLVTGATGFIGRLLVSRLLEEGRRVRLLQRRTAPEPDARLEVVQGDVTDLASVERAAGGVSSIVNLAGIVSHLESERAQMEAVNVGGVENVLAAARSAGVRRIVHVSSVASVGMAESADAPLNEDSPYPERARQYAYAATKRRGEEVAMAAAEAGQDVVVACPAFVIGAGDVNRISTFVAEQYLRGALRVVTAGGLSYVDVRDVADGILLVERSGESGRRYILGTPDGNLSHQQFFDLLGEVSGKRRLTLPLPASMLVPGAKIARALHIPLPVHPDELDSSRWYWYTTPQRAMRELGFSPRPVREAVESTVAYLRERGLRGR
jgi:dihydroflavonol-4-reductase